jgi:RHS repeat-associated protein
MNLNGTEYFYTRNLQGDVTGLIDSTGTQVVSYNYDSWGNVLSITGTLASTLGQKNPYKYRGYRQDAETGMYYLNSRYYVPEWGRFFTPDVAMNTTGDLNGYNLYAYAGNNPITFKDDNGFFIDTVFDIISVCISAYDFAKNPSWKNLGMLAYDVGAAVLPGLPGSATLKGAALIAGAVKGGSLVTAGTIKGGTAIVGITKGAGKIHGHHSFPKYLGGDPKQALSNMPDFTHRELHSDLGKFAGGILKAKNGYTGKDIIRNLGQEKVIGLLSNFYNQSKYKYLLDDFKAAVKFSKK